MNDKVGKGFKANKGRGCAFGMAPAPRISLYGLSLYEPAILVALLAVRGEGAGAGGVN